MPIVEDYDAIAKRLRELKTKTSKGAERITDLERWRDLAEKTARAYVENRRRSAATKPTPARPRRRGKLLQQ